MGILQARILKWVAMPSSRGSSQLSDWNPGLPHYRWILYSALIKLCNAHPNLLNSIYESKCQSLLEIPPQTHPEIIFNQISGHPLVQSSWHRTLTITHRYICIIYFLLNSLYFHKCTLILDSRNAPSLSYMMTWARDFRVQMVEWSNPDVLSSKTTWFKAHVLQTLGDSGRQRSLACYSPWGHKEPDTT